MAGTMQRSVDTKYRDFMGPNLPAESKSASRPSVRSARAQGEVEQFRQLGPQGVVDLVPAAENLYITFDIDVMDPSQAPGTGTPETGGLFYEETRECISALLMIRLPSRCDSS